MQGAQNLTSNGQRVASATFFPGPAAYRIGANPCSLRNACCHHPDWLPPFGPPTVNQVVSAN